MENQIFVIGLNMKDRTGEEMGKEAAEKIAAITDQMIEKQRASDQSAEYQTAEDCNLNRNRGNLNKIPVIDRQKTGIRLRQVMDQKGITVKEIQKYLGLSSVQSVYHWLNGTSMPTVDNLYALSGLFQMPMDALVCGNRTAFEKSGAEVGSEIGEERQRYRIRPSRKRKNTGWN